MISHAKVKLNTAIDFNQLYPYAGNILNKIRDENQTGEIEYWTIGGNLRISFGERKFFLKPDQVIEVSE